VASCPDPDDPLQTIQLDQLHYLDGGYRLIARNGAYFDLNPQGSDGIKQFYNSFPNLQISILELLFAGTSSSFKLLPRMVYMCIHTNPSVRMHMAILALVVGMATLILPIQESCMIFRCGSKAVLVVGISV